MSSNPSAQRTSVIVVAVILVVIAGAVLGRRLARNAAENTDPSQRHELRDGAGTTGEAIVDIATLAAFTPTMLDFGDVPPNATLPQVVTLRNLAAHPLRLATLHTSCGCLIARSASSIIPPGEALEIEIRFTTGSRPAQRVAYTVSATFEGIPASLHLPVRARTMNLLAFDTGAEDDPSRATVQALDGASLRLIEHPAFLTVMEPAEPAAASSSFLLSLRRGVEEDAVAPRPMLIFQHPRHGRLVIDWPAPSPGAWPALPAAPLPQVEPRPLRAVVTPDQLRAGETLAIELVGLTLADLAHVTFRTEGLRPFEVAMIEHAATNEGLRLIVRLSAEPTTWIGGAIVVMYDHQPLGTIRLLHERDASE